MKPSPASPPDRSAAERAAYATYDAALAAASLISLPALPLLLLRGYGEGLGERLGRLPHAAQRLAEPPIWLHAASVGESLAAAPLVARVRERCPGVPLVMSTTTATGRRVARERLRPDVVTLLPLDAWRIVDGVFRRLRPRCLIVMETEIWPGLLRAARAIGAPAAIASGRLSARALRRYRCVPSLFRAALRSVAAFAMQTREDAERILALGATPERVAVTGSLKEGSPAGPPPAPPLEGLASRPLVVAASTQPGEEEFVLAACAALWDSHPRLLLVLAPRRPERFDAVEGLLAGRGISYARRSRIEAAVPATARVLLLDSIGELRQIYPAGWAAFVGGTVAPLGGHNVLEPALYGSGVAFGPHTENVRDAAARLVAEGGAEVVREPADLCRFWADALTSRERSRAIGARARAAAARDSDVVERTWRWVAPALGLPT